MYFTTILPYPRRCIQRDFSGLWSWSSLGDWSDRSCGLKKILSRYPILGDQWRIEEAIPWCWAPWLGRSRCSPGSERQYQLSRRPSLEPVSETKPRTLPPCCPWLQRLPWRWPPPPRRLKLVGHRRWGPSNHSDHKTMDRGRPRQNRNRLYIGYGSPVFLCEC